MKAAAATHGAFREAASPRLMLRLAPTPEQTASSRAVSPDEVFLEALVRGDDAALTRLYKEHHQAVRALVRRMLSDGTDVEDVMHDVFLAAPAAFARYRGEASLRSFLFSIAVNQVRHHVRARSRRRSWLERFRLAPVHAPPPSTPEENESRRELADRLRRALDQLTFDHRAAVVLCEIEEMSAVEVAVVLEIPEATVRTRLFHAKKKLRALLEKEEAHG